MPSCVVPTCRKSVGNKAKETGITFHLFPTDEIRRSQWGSILQKARIDAYWKPGPRSYICSEHFEDNCFYLTKGGFKKLTKEAIPTKGIAMYVEESEVLAEVKAVSHPTASTSAIVCTK